VADTKLAVINLDGFHQLHTHKAPVSTATGAGADILSTHTLQVVPSISNFIHRVQSAHEVCVTDIVNCIQVFGVYQAGAVHTTDVTHNQESVKLGSLQEYKESIIIYQATCVG